MKEKFFIYRKKDRMIVSQKLIDLETLAEEYMHSLQHYEKYAVGKIFLKGNRIIDVEPRGFAVSELNKLILKK